MFITFCRLWSQLLTNIVLPELPKMLPKDRKVVVVGLIRMLTRSSTMLSEPTAKAWPSALAALVKLFSNPQHLQSAQSTQAEDPDVALTAIDFEEQTAGYQVAYSKLAASEVGSEDPVAYVSDPREFLGAELSRAGKADPRIRQLLGSPSDPAVGAFIQGLAASGLLHV